MTGELDRDFIGEIAARVVDAKIEAFAARGGMTASWQNWIYKAIDVRCGRATKDWINLRLDKLVEHIAKRMVQEFAASDKRVATLERQVVTLQAKLDAVERSVEIERRLDQLETAARARAAPIASLVRHDAS